MFLGNRFLVQDCVESFIGAFIGDVRKSNVKTRRAELDRERIGARMRVPPRGCSGTGVALQALFQIEARSLCFPTPIITKVKEG